jgi:hypothetical protein
MHATLTPRANFKLIALWSVLLVGCAPFSSPSAVLPLVAFAAAGIVAGMLQTRAPRGHRTSFRRAETALEVRHALVASVPGKLAVAMVWINAVALLVLVLSRREYANLQTVLGCYASFAFARECASLPGVFYLAKAS